MPVPKQNLLLEVPTVAECIPASIEALGTPAIFPFHKGLVTAVTATTELAQTHTVQGLNHLYGGWEFEATRHFCAALKEDPKLPHGSLGPGDVASFPLPGD